MSHFLSHWFVYESMFKIKPAVKSTVSGLMSAETVAFIFFFGHFTDSQVISNLELAFAEDVHASKILLEF